MKAFPSEIEELVSSLHSRPEDLEDGDLLERINSCSSFSLELVSLSALDPEEWSFDFDLASEYSKQEGDFPPIVLKDFGDGQYSIIDGTHRINAALIRGDKNIKAYVGYS